jgi:hypothetical protein
MELKQSSENFGIEQERLSGVARAKVRISSLAAPTGIGIELLEYLEPTDGRSIPTDTEFNDIWCWQTKIVVTDAIETIQQLHPSPVSLAPAEVVPTARHFCVRDPDGHQILLIDR